VYFYLFTGRQTRGCRGAWEELADWVTATYPWRSHTTSQPRHRDLPLLRLKPEDVGYAGVSSTSLADHVTQLAQVSPEVDEHADPLVDLRPLSGVHCPYPILQKILEPCCPSRNNENFHRLMIRRYSSLY